jgi:hypothetical protein
MCRKLVFIALLLVPGTAVWAYTSTTYIIWDGEFDLTVHVSSDYPGPPRSVTCQALGFREDAEHVLEHLLPPETRLWSTTADPFAGEPLTVHVPQSGRDSTSGRELRRFQFRYLVVIAELPDGRRVGKLVDIPDCRMSREVSVALP